VFQCGSNKIEFTFFSLVVENSRMVNGLVFASLLAVSRDWYLDIPGEKNP
jgi:hypothetical protein